jgi:regulator of sigma E protease
MSTVIAQRLIYILAAILIFGILIAVHELGHFVAAKLSGVLVNEFSIGMGPCLWSRQRGETRYSLRALPIGGFCAMEGEDEESDNPRALSRQGFWKKLVIFAAGAAMNFLTGFLIILLLYSGIKSFSTNRLVGFAPEFPQEESGLEAGDVILSANGERMYLLSSDLDLMATLDGDGKMDLVVKRNGEKVSLPDVPLQYDAYTGPDGKTYNGYGLLLGVEDATVLSRLKISWLNAVDFVREVRLSLQMLLSGKASMNDVSGPVGIVSVITQVGEKSENAKAAAQNILYFAALIAVNLAVMNLLPIPALDGGHILFLILDEIALRLIKRRIPGKYEAAINLVFLIALLGFMAVVTFHDVYKLIR